MSSTSLHKYAVIVAGGKGLRMGADIPKQFIEIGGLPILMHTILRFINNDADTKIILVLPHSQQEYWKRLCDKYKFKVNYTVVDGGETRFESVKNGLAAIPEGENLLIAVHDGVRPFVSDDVINLCFETADAEGTAIPVLPVTDTLRDIRHGCTVARSDYRAVQTPQVFKAGILKKAYDCPYNEAFTDDASVVEAGGISVTLVEGNRENIKLTTPYDLRIAELFVSK